MFKNPGAKLKSLAKVIFWISLIIWIIVGVAIVASGSTGNDALGPTVAAIAGLFVIIIGLIISWLSTILIFAIGSAVDDIQTIKEVQLDLKSKREAF